MFSYVSINTAKPVYYEAGGKSFSSALRKKGSDKPLYLSETYLEGDEQADLEHHGGVYKAALLYSHEHYAFWQKELSTGLCYGSFGETITTKGLTEKNVRIGDIYSIGEAQIKITQPRQVCYKFGCIYEKEMPAKMDKTGFTGFYASVLQPGILMPKGEIKLIYKADEKFTVEYINNLLINDKENNEAMEEAILHTDLAPSIKRVFEIRLGGGADKEFKTT